MRFQPHKGKYLAAASEKAIYILDGETQHACRSPLQVGYQGVLMKSAEDAFAIYYSYMQFMTCVFSFFSSKFLSTVMAILESGTLC